MTKYNREKNGGPAFPQQSCGLEDGMPLFEGMSLRDWFAGNASLEEIVLNMELLEALAGPAPAGDWASNPQAWFAWSNRWQAAVKYARADAMLAERNKAK